MGGPWALFTMTIERRFTLLGSVNARQALRREALKLWPRSSVFLGAGWAIHLLFSDHSSPFFRLATRKELESRLFRGTCVPLVC